MGAVAGKMFNFINIGVGLTSGVMPALVTPLIVFGMRMSPYDNSFDLIRYLFSFIGILLVQFIGVNLNDIKYKSNVPSMYVSTINTAVISALFIASHFVPVFGMFLTTVKSRGWKGELYGNLLSLGIISSFIFMFNNILKDTFMGALYNKYTMILSLIAIIGATYFASLNHVYFTSSPIQFPLKKVLSLLPPPARLATPIALQIINPDVLNNIKVDTPEQKETVELLRRSMSAILKSLPVDIEGSLQKVDNLIKKSPIKLNITTGDVIAELSGIDIRKPGVIENIVKDPTINLFMKLVKNITSGDYMNAITTIPGTSYIVNKSLDVVNTASSLMEGGYYY
jgi:hypothetical protein